jgi:hypothetical protein
VWLMVDSEEVETRLLAKSESVASNPGSDTNIESLFKSVVKWADMLLISML